MSKDGIDNMSGSRPSSRMWEPELIILVDSREQLPYSFSCPSVVGTVPTGDYSVPGCEHLVAVERKSLPDLCQSITRERVRFEKELARSRQIPTFHLIVEGGAYGYLARRLQAFQSEPGSRVSKPDNLQCSLRLTRVVRAGQGHRSQGG